VYQVRINQLDLRRYLHFMCKLNPNVMKGVKSSRKDKSRSHSLQVLNVLHARRAKRRANRAGIKLFVDLNHT
jgi:hypothetical protein